MNVFNSVMLHLNLLTYTFVKQSPFAHTHLLNEAA